MASTISSWVTTWSLVQASWASSGMNSMKRTLTPRSRPKRGEVDELVVVDAPHDDDVELHRVEPGLEGGVDAVEHRGRARRAG